MKKSFTGKIVSTKMQDTAVVEVEMWKTHRIYKKRYQTSTKFKVHNPGDKHQMDEVVTIQETKPRSKTVCWEIIEK